MSLFDVIRYPISYPPTKEELDALPTELYLHWIKNSDWSQFIEPDTWEEDQSSMYATSHVSNWYKSNISDSKVFKESDRLDLLRLRSIIEHWDKDIE